MNQPIVIYLDLNHWVSLAQAYHGHVKGQEYKLLLEKIITALESEQIILPLSASHIIETGKISDMARRQRLAHVMAKFSQGITISPQFRITHWEVKASIEKFFKTNFTKIPSVIGKGIPFAFGMVSVLTDVRTGQAVIMSQEQNRILDSIMTSTDAVEKFLINSDETVRKIAVDNYAQSSSSFVLRAEELRLKIKNSTKNSDDKAFHRRAYMGNLILSMQNELTQALSQYGISFQDFLNLGPDGLLAFFESIPTLDVEIELIVERNKNWSRKIDINDKMDIAFLSVAIPYCDIVVTEKFFRFSADKTKLGKKYQTFITNKINDIGIYL